MNGRAPHGVTPLSPAPRDHFSISDRRDVCAGAFDVHCPHGLTLELSRDGRGFQLHSICGQSIVGDGGWPVVLEDSGFTAWLERKTNEKETTCP